MIRCLFPLLFLVLLGGESRSQRAQRIMLGLQADLIRGDNDGFFEKLQAGAEASFYVSRKFAATGGLEWWSPDQTFIIAGVRFCPIDEAFIRVRALLGEDLSVGGGFAKPLNDHLRLEAMADYYGSGLIAIRAGLALGIGARP